MADFVTVGEAARHLDIPPAKITGLFYRRALDVRRCPLIGGRRMIPREYVGEIAAVLIARGMKPEAARAS